MDDAGSDSDLREMKLPVLEWPRRHPSRISRPRDAAERRRVESVLAVARLVFACAALSATMLLPDGAPENRATVRTLMFAYTAQSALIAAVAQSASAPLGPWPFIIHVLDIVWAATLTAATTGPNSPLFVLFLFALLGAAYRWGLRETVLTGVAALALFTAEAGLPTHHLFGGPPLPFDLRAVLVRTTYLIMGAIVLGYLAEEEQLRHAESTIITEVLTMIQADTGFRAALRHVVTELLQVSEARRLIVVAVQSDSGRTVWWEAELRGDNLLLEPQELNDEARRDTLQFPVPGDAARIVRKRNGCETLALDEEGGILGRRPCDAPQSLWNPPDSQAATIVNVRFADHWSGRVVLLLDRTPGIGEVRLMQHLICQAVPVMYAHYLVRRLRTRVARTERLRLARELHDGVIQSLAGLEMHVDALRRTRADAIRAAGLDDDLGELQALLREEAGAVRDVMHQIRPLEIARGQIVRVFADLVSRFERESGVEARFTADDDGADVPPLIARELGRTLQEALRNVRKHGDAKHVDVTFTTENGNWKLIVANDGRPFDFRGLWTLQELEARMRGPRVIKERVREMGGDLTIESTPAKGVRLEVTVPRKRSLLASLT